MLIPVNSAAEEIVRRKEINGDILKQIEQLQTSIAKNDEIVTALTDIAEWNDIPDPTPNPEPTPEALPVADAPAIDPTPATN